MAQHQVTMTVNGAKHSFSVSSHERLIDLLRDELGLKSIKEGCGTGDCGICAVIMDGRLVNSCLALAAMCGGKKVTTLEGTFEDHDMKRLQRAFMANNAAQCGFCTPAMLMAGWDVAKHTSNPSTDEIKTAISGVLCRCTGYYQIIDAVREGCRGEGER